MPSSLVVALGLLTISAAPYGGSVRAPALSGRMPSAGYSNRLVQSQEVVPPGEMEVVPPGETEIDALASDGEMSYQMGNPGCGCCNSCSGCDHSGGASLPCCWSGTCNLFPHVPYYVEPKTYYYFRPYNYMHVNQQRNQAMHWGTDPRHPYANEVFKQVYKEIDSESGVVPLSEPKPDEVEGGGAAVPAEADRASAVTFEVEQTLDRRLIDFLEQALVR